MSTLSGKRALVTGASRGVGFAVAKAFAAAGAEVVATARNQEGLLRLQQDVEAFGGRLIPLPGDLTTRAGAREIADQAGQIDVLVNNAAVTSPTFKTFLTEDDDHWDLQFGVNLYAPVILMRSLGVGMIERGNGSIINISTTGAHRPSPLHAPYGASKAALEVASRAAAIEFGPHGVRVNCVALGLTDTEGLQLAIGEGVRADDIGRKINPIGRATRVSEVAALCVLLAGDECAAMTGTVIALDGGITAGDFSSGPAGALTA